MELGVLLESPQGSQSSSRVGACTCSFLPSCNSSVTLSLAWIKGSVAFPRGFPTRLSHEAFPQVFPTSPGSGHHSQSPPDVSVRSRETCFPCTASTFKPRINSHHEATRDSLVGNPRGKPPWNATDPMIHAKESVTLLLQLGRKAHVHAPTRDED